VRVNLVLVHDGLRIRARTDVDVVTLDRTNEGFGHTIAETGSAR
jgi:hypothetical protein